MSEQRRILDMLTEGQITADQATELLEALKASDAPPPPSPPKAPKPKGIAKVLRISIDAHEGDGSSKAKVNVNVPLGLAKFASKFLPQQAREQLDLQGIDISNILESLGSDVPEGRIVDIDAQDGDGSSKAKIVIEVA